LKTANYHIPIRPVGHFFTRIRNNYRKNVKSVHGVSK